MKQNELQKTIMVFSRNTEALHQRLEDHPRVNQIVFMDDKMIILKLNAKNLPKVEQVLQEVDAEVRIASVGN